MYTHKSNKNIFIDVVVRKIFESKLTVVERLHYECIVNLSLGFNSKAGLGEGTHKYSLAQIGINTDSKEENMSKTLNYLCHIKKCKCFLYCFFLGDFCFLCVFER